MYRCASNMATGYDGVVPTEQDIADSRKRPLDGEIDSGITKRSHHGADESELFVPSRSDEECGKIEGMEVHHAILSRKNGKASGVDGVNAEMLKFGESNSTSPYGSMHYTWEQWTLKDGTYHFKILVPSVAAGAIIGKGGETIAQLQKETGARVKMSKANDFYPGTTERVCLISGNADAIMHVHNFIMEKIREKPDPNAKPAIDFDNKQSAEREKQVKILVPNSTAGMIIGKGGNYIKQIKEESGAYIQISQKAKEQTLTERCITVIGDMEHNKKACSLILGKIMEDPQSNSNPNVSYADVTGPVANFNPTGSPFANTTSMTIHNSTANLANTLLGNLALKLSGANTNAIGLGPSVASNLNTGQLLENLQTTLRNSGFSDQATNEITAAMNTLASYGILGLGLGMSSLGALSLGSPTTAGLLNASTNSSTANLLVNNSGVTSPVVANKMGGAMVGGENVFGPIGSTASDIGNGFCPSTTPTSASGRSADRFGIQSDHTFDLFNKRSNNGNSSSSNYNSNSFGLGPQIAGLNKSPTPNDKSDPNLAEIEIHENIVGAILGQGGRALVEIQQFSGANIQISKKGVYSPGTRNRIVTITGNPNCVHLAQFLIQQRISQEEAKRARQNNFAL